MKREEFSQLPKTVCEFLNYLDTIQNKSSLTVSEYASDLRIFFRFMKIYKKCVPENTEFNKIDVSDIDIDFISKIEYNDFLYFLAYCKNTRNISSRAMARKITTLRKFFKFLIHNKYIDENPALELDTPKIKKALPKFLTLEQSRMLLNCIDGSNKQRDYCIMTLFLNCGIRLSELVGLNLNDITDDGKMKVTGKGNKERIVYLNDACQSAIKAYLKVRPVDGVKDKDALFISRNKQRISNRMVQTLVEKYLDRSGLGNMGFSTHKLRHTAATLMYQYGDVDVLLLKEILGHENLSTTQIYTHVSNEQLKDAMGNNPLNNIAKPDFENEDDD